MLDIGLFRSFIVSLAILYLLSCGVLVIFIYFLHQILGEEWAIIISLSAILSIFVSIILAKISIKPLIEHIKNLEEFSAQTLHELNLPIATINTNVSMLLKNSTNERDIRRLERILEASKMLQNRYDELDYLIKTESFKESIEACDIATIVASRVDFFKSLYIGVQWRVTLAPCEIVCDPIGFAKVVDNLIENAIKYSPNNPIITIDLDENRLIIADNGIGMDEITIMHIYERYFQSDELMRGFGIGLNLVKRYCDRHNITVEIESVVGEKSIIYLNFRR